jgi:Ribose/xylose/arabinose/galactoside ABC-type transport systems, permease components
MKRFVNIVGGLARRYSIIFILAVLLIISSVISSRFFSWSNIINILTQASPLGIICIGATFLMISGYRDLSVGMVMGLSAALTMGLQPILGIWSFVVGVIAGIAVGLINGFLVSTVGIHTFVVTLAMMQGVRSLTYIYTKEAPIVGSVPSFAELGKGSFLGLPNILWIFLVYLIFMELVLKYTRHGKNTYAVGGNMEAAFNAGIPVRKTVMINFVICSVSGAFGGILNAARANSTTATLGWPNTHFLVMVMIVLGGTKLAGGYGNELFTLGGIFVYYTLQNIMNMLNVHTYFATMFTGILLIVVLILDKVIKPTAEYKRADNRPGKDVKETG